jgi:dihydrofolate reductase
MRGNAGAGPCVSLIAALAANRVIGRDNALPWHLPEDLRHFRALTRGHPVIMGRRTYESIGRPLPDRQNLVITRDPHRAIPGVELATSLENALALARPARGEVFVIGGAEIYALALPRADRLHLTLIERDVEGNARFPEWRELGFRETESRPGEDAVSGLRYRFTTWERATPARP